MVWTETEASLSCKESANKNFIFHFAINVVYRYFRGRLSLLLSKISFEKIEKSDKRMIAKVYLKYSVVEDHHDETRNIE